MTDVADGVDRARAPTASSPARGPEPMTPALYRVVENRRETVDVVTISLTPVSNHPFRFRPGQFNMLTALGVGEAAISMSRAPRDGGDLTHTVRDVGPVSHALCETKPGDVVGVRGPFGTDWGVEGMRGDVVVVAGGIGLAPLRGAVDELVTRQGPAGPRVFVLVGARQPDQVLFEEDLEAWSRGGAEVHVTVDVASPRWQGRVGLVTSLLAEACFEPGHALALLCGPEVMIRFTASALVGLGVDAEHIRVSLERNMQCGLGWCGHCQLGPFLLCRDGPVLPFTGLVEHLLTVRER